MSLTAIARIKYPLGESIGTAAIIVAAVLLQYFTGVIQVTPVQVAICAAVGYLSRLICDSLTPKGIAWFVPLSSAKLSIGIITIGGMLETLFAVAAGLGTITLLVMFNL